MEGRERGRMERGGKMEGRKHFWDADHNYSYKFTSTDSTNY